MNYITKQASEIKRIQSLQNAAINSGETKMQTYTYSQDNDQNNNDLIIQETVSQQSALEHNIAAKIDAVRRFTLLLGFAQATLANKYDKKRALSKKTFNQLTVSTLKNDSINQAFQEVQFLQEEITDQLNKVSLLNSQLEEAEAALAVLIL